MVDTRISNWTSYRDVIEEFSPLNCHLYHIYKGSMFAKEMQQEDGKSQRLGGLLKIRAFWTQQCCCTHELKLTVVACTKSSKSKFQQIGSVY